MEPYQHIGFTNKKEIMGLIIILVLFVITLIYGVYVARHVCKVYDSRTFVYPKTGDKYHVEKVVRAKHPDTGEWYEAILYFDLKDKHEYVREKQDFIDKLISLKEWREQKNQIM